jgi:Ca2+-binding EF-hand superfamily protein
LTFLVNNLTKDIDFKSLRDAFRTLDKNNSGFLNLAEIRQAFIESNIPTEEADEIFIKIDLDNDGLVNYSQFLTATVDKKQTLTMQNLWFAFHHFDVDNTGFITEKSLKEVFMREGKKFTDE